MTIEDYQLWLLQNKTNRRYDHDKTRAVLGIGSSSRHHTAPARRRRRTAIDPNKASCPPILTASHHHRTTTSVKDDDSRRDVAASMTHARLIYELIWYYLLAQGEERQFMADTQSYGERFE